ncbi:MAG TPA: NRDE family protein [Rubricoccaceae bacterium]|jgi:uncharacterized protein with NRDE domain
MCVLFFALGVHPGYALVLAGNRDEAHARPTAPLALWPDAPEVAAGRDLEAGGTWLGVTRTGRWATVTNVRDPGSVRPDARSRGALVSDFLRGTDSPETYAQRVQAERGVYNGFNLLVGQGAEAWLASTRRTAAEPLAPGIYGLSNDTLDTPWPKLVRGRDAFAEALRADDLVPSDLLPFLHDETLAADASLPDTGVGVELERVLSPLFIRGARYGTRASTALMISDAGAGRIAEHTWGPDGVSGLYAELCLGTVLRAESET